MTLLLTLGIASQAQDVVAVDKGSYAAFPPAHEGDTPTRMVGDYPIYVMPDETRPIPTNDWWTHLIDDPFSGALWAFPLRVDAKEHGLDVYFPTEWNEQGSDPVSELPVKLGGESFTAVDARAKDWGDWTLTMRSGASDGRHIDFTIGRGLPYVWAEYAEGVVPKIAFSGDTLLFDRRNNKLDLRRPTDHIGIRNAGRNYAVFAPANTRFAIQGDAIFAKFAGKERYLVLCPLPTARDLEIFYQHAYAIPRNSHYDWTYDPEKGQVTTRFTLETEPLRADAGDELIQGFLPHHYRGTTHELAFNDMAYLTARGTMKCAVGNSFEITYPFKGFVPNLPVPTATQGELAFDPERMADYLARYSERSGEYGGDTYWGGKDLVRLAKYMDIAYQMNDSQADALRDALRVALADWFTYTPGEQEKYFARYDNWKAFVGFNESYGSAQFTDNHFHYGYFTLAAAMLAMHDPAFLEEYGSMVSLVARQYANWNRDADDFPYLRTFDPWAGHSYAGGLSSPRGNNQESTSEAIQSWGGLFLLGTMLGDDQMRACGAMGYAVESSATLEYWFDQHGDNFSERYAHPIVGILFNSHNAYATFFSGDPAWIHGIQWLPVHPMLDFLAEDREWAKGIYENMLAERKSKEGDDSISSLGTALGNVILGQQLQFDPDATVATMEALWEAGDPVAKDNYTGGLTYYFAHAMKSIGFRDRTVHFSEPTSAAYLDDVTGEKRFVVYNPKPYPQLIKAYQDGAEAGVVFAPALALTTVNKLQPITQGPGVAAMSPGPDAQGVPRFIDTIFAVFNTPLQAESLQGITLAGPEAPGITVENSGVPNVITIRLQGRLVPSESYRVAIPATLKQPDGSPALTQETAWSFTVEDQPPLAIVEATPAQGASRVPGNLQEMSVLFNAPIDPESLTKVAMTGPGNPQLLIEPGMEAAELVAFAIKGELQPDSVYTVTLPAELKTLRGQHLPTPAEFSFTTAPSPCPPNVYTESFAGMGFGKDDELSVDFNNAESPHAGKFAIKLTAAEKNGSLYLFHGTADQGDGRDPVDLTDYDRLSFYIKGDAGDTWLKIGHPVFDLEAFHLTHFTKLSNRYQLVTLPIPEPRDQINTLLAVSVAAGKTIYLDDIRFLKPGE